MREGSGPNFGKRNLATNITICMQVIEIIVNFVKLLGLLLFLMCVELGSHEPQLRRRGPSCLSERCCDQAAHIIDCRKQTEYFHYPEIGLIRVRPESVNIEGGFQACHPTLLPFLPGGLDQRRSPTQALPLPARSLFIPPLPEPDSSAACAASSSSP